MNAKNFFATGVLLLGLPSVSHGTVTTFFSSGSDCSNPITAANYTPGNPGPSITVSLCVSTTVEKVCGSTVQFQSASAAEDARFKITSRSLPASGMTDPNALSISLPVSITNPRQTVDFGSTVTTGTPPSPATGQLLGTFVLQPQSAATNSSYTISLSPLSAIATEGSNCFGSPTDSPISASLTLNKVGATSNRVRNDFNGDGKRDILLENVNGAHYVWHINGASISGGNVAITTSGDLDPSSGGWSVVPVSVDFNGDGKADILLQHTSGALYAWMVDGTVITSGRLQISSNGALPSLGSGSGWSIAAAGDFNGDGKSDLLLQHTSGALYAWMIDGSTISGGNLTLLSNGNLPSLGSGSGWSVFGVGDFNGDGKADILLQHTSGALYAWMVDGATISGGYLTLLSNGNLPSLGSGSGWSVAGLGDFNGDGKADILLQHTSGALYAWMIDGSLISGGYLTLLSNGGLPSLGSGSGWSIGAVGDFNGDGKADILLQHTNGGLYLWTIDGATISGGMLSVPTNGALPTLSGGWSNKVMK
jgi:hypothetical protein